MAENKIVDADLFVSHPGFATINKTIFSHMDPRTLANSRLVSKSWKNFIDSSRALERRAPERSRFAGARSERRSRKLARSAVGAPLRKKAGAHLERWRSDCAPANSEIQYNHYKNFALRAAILISRLSFHEKLLCNISNWLSYTILVFTKIQLSSPLLAGP